MVEGRTPGAQPPGVRLHVNEQALEPAFLGDMGGDRGVFGDHGPFRIEPVQVRLLRGRVESHCRFKINEIVGEPRVFRGLEVFDHLLEVLPMVAFPAKPPGIPAILQLKRIGRDRDHEAVEREVPFEFHDAHSELARVDSVACPTDELLVLRDYRTHLSAREPGRQQTKDTSPYRKSRGV